MRRGDRWELRAGSEPPGGTHRCMRVLDRRCRGRVRPPAGPPGDGCLPYQPPARPPARRRVCPTSWSAHHKSDRRVSCCVRSVDSLGGPANSPSLRQGLIACLPGTRGRPSGVVDQSLRSSRRRWCSRSHSAVPPPTHITLDHDPGDRVVGTACSVEVVASAGARSDRESRPSCRLFGGPPRWKR